jgi:hypothetical protein
MIPAAELSASKPVPQRRYTQMRYGLVSISAAMVLAFAFTNAHAQQPTPTAQPTPAARWCPEIPESPPPPGWIARQWASQYKFCSSLTPPANLNDRRVAQKYDQQRRYCAQVCSGAMIGWRSPENPPPKKVWKSTNKLQGPFHLGHGTTGYILPVPTSTATPDTSSAPESLQGSSDPGGPFAGGYFAGADVNASSDTQPPDVAADVSPTQNVEFVNVKGMYIWSKPTLPITSSPTPQITSRVDFWCTGSSINGQSQSQCVSGAPPSGYALTDEQIGYDASLDRWIVTTLLHLLNRASSTPADYVYIAVSNSGTAAGPSDWTKWSVPVCTSNSSFPSGDQPLLGWSGGGSQGLVGVDVLCYDESGTVPGADSLIVIPNSDLAPTPASSLPNAITPPCIGTTPARDEDAGLSSLYLVSSVVPGDPGITEPSGCGVNNSNISPYVVEYTAEYVAAGAEVFGQDTTNACSSGTACTPLSEVGQLWNPGEYFENDARSGGNAQQLGPGGAGTGALLDPGDARIKAAQIRETTDSTGASAPILTLGFNTVYQPGDSLTGSQALWALEDLGNSTWTAFALVGNGTWMSYPTIAMDSHLGMYFGTTWMGAGIYPSTVWDLVRGTTFPNFTLEGQNGIEQSTSEYTGDGTPARQRWGDYNTMVYDPYAVGPSGGPVPVFWSIEEASCPSLSSAPCSVGADESTSWVALEDLPFFVGSKQHESECVSSTGAPLIGSTCGVKISPPAGVQPGDLLLTTLVMGQGSNHLPTVPAGWTLLAASNLSGSPQQLSSSNPCGNVRSSWLAAHVYGTSEPSSYKFTHHDAGDYNSCQNYTFNAELAAFMTVYRGAGQNTGDYTAYGFTQNGNSASFSTTATTPPTLTQLATIFIATNGTDQESIEPDVIISSPTGSPSLTPETSLTPAPVPFLDADVGVPPGPSEQYGPYSISDSSTGTNRQDG